jgi:hypothetical protein
MAFSKVCNYSMEARKIHFSRKMVHGNDYRHKEPLVLRTGNLHVQIQLENAEPNQY